MLKTQQKEVTQKEIEFLKKYHQKQLETNEKKYT